MPQKPTFSVHVDDEVVNHPTPAPKQVLQFDKVLSAKKPDKHSVMEALRNKVLWEIMYIFAACALWI